MAVTFRAKFFGPNGQQNNPFGALMSGKAIGSAGQIFLYGSVGSRYAFVTWQKGLYNIDLTRSSRGVTSEDVAGVQKLDGQESCTSWCICLELGHQRA